MASHSSEDLSDSDLTHLAIEISKDANKYWLLGIDLGTRINVLESMLKESKDDMMRATLKLLTQWRTDNPTPTRSLRSDLEEICKKRGWTSAEKTLSQATEGSSTSSEKYPKLTVQVASSETSSSILKGDIIQRLEQETEEGGIETISMVTSVTSSGDRESASLAKETKSFNSSRPSGVPRSADGHSSTGLSAAIGQVHLRSQRTGAAHRSTGLSVAMDGIQIKSLQHNDSMNPTERVAKWMTDDPQLRGGRRGAAAADILSQSGAMQKESLKLKDYQKELAGPAILGQNTVIVAPTGSGKTYVSVAVALEVLRKTKGKGKIVFVVNQVPLVHQQSTVFRKYMDKVSYVCGDHGLSASTRLPLAVLLKENSVVVLTAQILVDALVKGQVFLKDIALIIFDECHETKKESQYNKVMEKYFEMKWTLQRAGEDVAKSLPQILGMTASLGVGNALKKNDAVTYMVNICANLDAVRVSTVKRHRKSLADVENKPKEDCHTVRGREKDAFGEEIQDIMFRIIIWINKTPGCELFSNTMSALSKLRSSSHACENFNHMLCRLNGQISEQAKDSRRHRKLKTYTEYLKEYSTSLSIHETARTKDALLYLQNFIKKEEEKGNNLTSTDLELIKLFREREAKLDRLSKSRDSKNPGLVKLQELLDDACHSLDGGLANFRGILFTQTIASTNALKAWTMDTPGLREFNAEAVVGSRNPGMSLRHQADILDKFRHGEHKLLIATSVVQQGIDVPACNFVFRYNYISDAVGRIQARGRTRAPGGRFELVVHQERGLEKKDQLGKQQEQVMREATEELSELPEETLKGKITAIQRRQQMQYRHSRLPLGHKSLDSLNHEFRCQKCRVLVCRSSDIRVISGGHHVIIAPEFLEKKVVRPSSDGYSPEKREWTNTRKSERELACKDCHVKWGSVLKFRDAYILAIAVKYFLVTRKNSKPKRYMKWSSLPFTFEEVSLEDVAHPEEYIY